MKSQAHSHFGLMLPWEPLRVRSESSIQQDFLSAPLQVGPIGVLDSMLIDNTALQRTILDEEFYNLAEAYVEAGLLTLWHRAEAPDGHPIERAADLLRIWLCRTTPERAKDVHFASLTNSENEALRGWLVKQGGKPFESVKTEFLRDYAPASLREALPYWDRLFFRDVTPYARFVAGNPSERAQPIQRRFLAGLGVSPKSVDYRATPDAILEQLLLERKGRFLSDTEVELLVGESTLLEPLCREILPATKDCGRVVLRDSVGVLERSARDDCKKLGRKLVGLVDTIFARGYPELFSMSVVNVPGDEEAALRRSRAAAVGASVSARRDHAALISTTLSTTRIAEELEGAFWEAATSEDDRRLRVDGSLSTLRTRVFGERRARLTRKEIARMQEELRSDVVGMSYYGAAVAAAGYMLGREEDAVLWAAVAGGIGMSTSIVRKLVMLARAKPKMMSQAAAFSREHASAYRDIVSDLEVG